jgi:hypothetical protein
MTYARLSRALNRRIRYLVALALLNEREWVAQEDTVEGRTSIRKMQTGPKIALQYCKTAVLDYALKTFRYQA